MRASLIRWSIYLLAALIIGPVAGQLVASLRTPSGVGLATPLTAGSMLTGLLYLLVIMALAFVPGILGARFSNARTGLIAAGLVVCWPAWRTAQVNDLIRVTNAADPLRILSLESAILAILGLFVSIVIWRLGRRGEHPHDEPARNASLVSLVTGKGPVILGGALLAAAIVGWLVAITPLKGQAVAAAIAAATAAGVAARLIDDRAPIPTIMLAMGILSILAPLAGLFLTGSDRIVRAMDAGGLFPLSQIAPLDWIAGSLIGIPWGIGWAGSMFEKQQGGGTPDAKKTALTAGIASSMSGMMNS